MMVLSDKYDMIILDDVGVPIFFRTPPGRFPGEGESAVIHREFIQKPPELLYFRGGNDD